MHRWNRAAGIGSLYAVLSLAFCAPLFSQPTALGIIDWDEKLSYYGAVLKTVLEYGQVPFWNPWQCGGDVLWQNPLVSILSLVYPLSIVMPLALAMKIEILLHYWIGFIGMHLLLADVIGLTFLPLTVFLGSVFVMSGALAIHLAVGHSVFLPAFYLPWLLYCLLRALSSGSVRYSLMGGAVLALMIFNAGLHMVSMAVVMVAGIAVGAAAAHRSWRPIALAAALGIAGGIYSAPKLVPVALYVTSDQFWDTRGPSMHPDRMTTTMISRAYLDPYQYYGLRDVDDAQQWGWWEYGNYIGAPAALLFVSCFVMLVWTRKRRNAWLGISLAVTTLFLFVWSVGEFSAAAPASLANHLLFFSKFRIPSRFTIAVVLVAIAFSGWTLAAVAEALSGDARRVVALLCALGSLQLLVQNRYQLAHVFSVPPLDRGLHLFKGPHQLAIDRTSNPYASNSPMLRDLMNDTALFNCYASFQLKHTADPDTPLVSTTGDARILNVSVTPNRIDFSAVGGRAPATVILNQNFADGWRSSIGPVAADAKSGKPAAVLAPGQTGRFSFTFVAPGVLLGWTILMAGVVASWLIWISPPSAPAS